MEDDVPLASALRRGLRAEGIVADVAVRGEDALWMIAAGEFDAVVLDVMLPGIDGFETCRRLRGDGVWTPIIMLTARDEVDDRVRGLDEGADDYLVKPFSLAELLARLRALARRGPVERPVVLEVGSLRLDPATHEVWRGDSEIELSPKEFALLEAFMRRPGEVISQLSLLEHAWDYDYENRSNVVEVYVGYLRQKIDRPSACARSRRCAGRATGCGATAGSARRQRALARREPRADPLAADRGIRARDGGGAGRGGGVRLPAAGGGPNDSINSQLESGTAPADPEEGFARVVSPGEPVDGAILSRRSSRARVMNRWSWSSVPGVEGEARILARPGSGGDVVLVARSLEDREETLEGLITSFAVGGPIAVLVASLLGYLLAGFGLRPVEAMRRQASEISFGGGVDERLPLPAANDEVRRLGETLNEMLDRLRGSYERERRFVADASHELRTPLSVLKTELEGTLRSPGLDPGARVHSAPP